VFCSTRGSHYYLLHLLCSIQSELCAAFKSSLAIWRGEPFPTFELAACADKDMSLVEQLARASPDAKETDFQGMFGGRCGWW
jgi:hypothetical protein